MDRSELMEAALYVYPEGLALIDLENHILFWNRAAECLTGHASANVLGREVPEALDPLNGCREDDPRSNLGTRPRLGKGALVHLRHQKGHDIPTIARKVVLRDGLGRRIGAAAVFHLAENMTALPHGETSEGAEVRDSQAELRDRLEAEFEAFESEGTSLGVLWILVDQAHDLRKTHGAKASEAMLESVERVLANAVRPGEAVGRWGDDEFLVLAHQATGDLLAKHGQVLAGIARTAVFSWWGDRVSLTVSIGAAVAEYGDNLPQFLERARKAMRASVHKGGNSTTLEAGRQECSPS